MRFIYDNFKKGIKFALYVVLLNNIVIEIINHGKTYTTDWQFLKLFIGSIIVSLGYSFASAIYLVKKIPLWGQIIIQLMTGTLVFIIVGYINNWLIPDNKSYNVIVIVGQVFVAVMYLTINYIYNIRMIDEINKALKR